MYGTPCLFCLLCYTGQHTIFNIFIRDRDLFSDYFLQYFSVKRLGGGKNAIYGTMIGILLGVFFPPIGFVLGPFLGAFIVTIPVAAIGLLQFGLTFDFWLLLGVYIILQINLFFSINLNAQN